MFRFARVGRRARTHPRVSARLGARVGLTVAAFGVLLALGWAGAPPSAGAQRVTYPWAVLDSAVVEGNRLVARGYGFDFDSAGQIDIVMAIDQVGTKLSRHRANEFRPDVGRVFTGRSYSGFTARSVPLTVGSHVMCIAAQNIGSGEPWRLFGCKFFDVRDPNPTGRLETLTSQGNRFVASGWALDRQTPIPNEVRIDVDGVPTARVRAMNVRNDLARWFPGLGNQHGFEVTVPMGPGRHRVCATSLNLDAGNDVGIGCATVDAYPIDPFGALESVAVEGNAVVTRGWAVDPDATGPSTIVVTARRSPLVDPVKVSTIAFVNRPDIGAAHGTDPNRGFVLALPNLEPGPQTICVGISNRGFGVDTSFGCRNVVFPERRPTGSLTAVDPLPGGLRVRGTVTDPDGSPVTTRIVVDGVLDRTIAVGGGGSFDQTVNGLADGPHSVCVTAVDVTGSAPGRTGDRAITCGSAVVGDVAVGTTGQATALSTVGPPVGHPLRNVDRDAGLSVTLSDGSTLWLFGDSAEVDSAGKLKYFVSGTAAWAEDGQPTVTTDAAVAGRPVKFATPVSWNGPCPANAPNQVMWPISAVAVPEGGGRDRVVAFMENVCLGETTGQSRGMAVVEWDYDSVSPPDGEPIVGTVLNQFVRPTRTYGMSSVFVPANGADPALIYVYSCDGPLYGGWYTEYGPCTVSRVPPAQVHVTSAYRYWTGTSWALDGALAADLTMPQMRLPAGNTIPVFPVASFTVRWDANFGAYVMVYSPWPGFTDQVAVRVAARPEGPWSAPVQVMLPGCNDSIGGKQYLCYAGTAQPTFSTATSIGIGYYDQLVSTGPNRGAYMVARVPLSVEVP